ncbi:MAG TPA: hypothetical protein VFI41_12595 [Gemmatimonadales bacterium]|nr:hypothetical protein [Gemmatimonadales bacterium]
MKKITFYPQKARRIGRARQWSQFIIEDSASIPGGLFFADGLPNDDPFFDMDLDQVEELHRRLGAHLAEHGRGPQDATPVKWRDG